MNKSLLGLPSPQIILAVAFTASLLTTGPAVGNTENLLAGRVADESGEPLHGALVTLTRADGLYAETVYSDADGEYRLTTDLDGAATLRARRVGFADDERTVRLPDDAGDPQTFVLRRLANAVERSDHLTASAHMSRLRFEDGVAEGFFRVECLTCHQLGNAFTRQRRSPEQWAAIVDRMLGYWGLSDPAKSERYTALLARGFDGAALDLQQRQQTDPAIEPARIRQWKLPRGVIAHDVEHYSGDGKFYTVDQGLDLIYITDPVSNTTDEYAIPGGDIPIGGKFFTMMGVANPVGLSVRRGPHSLQEGPDGKFYTTDTISGQIGVFDPRQRTYTGHDVGGNAMYPHTLRFDRHGVVWFTISMSNQVGRFDPPSGGMTVIDLPPDTDRPDVPLFIPYGIDIHPLDGSVWYSRLFANRIGRIDPDTLEVEEFSPPTIGPRRMRFSKDGTLWIPSYGDGHLVRLDTRTMQFTRFRLPTLSPEEIETPYAVGVHPATQDVWITANMSDRAFRFLPGEERFIAYPLPTRGIFLRDMIFTPDGEVCAASSMAPAPLAVEGGMEEVICIEP